CPAGFADCDGDPKHVCETKASSDHGEPNNGTCGGADQLSDLSEGDQTTGSGRILVAGDLDPFPTQPDAGRHPCTSAEVLPRPPGSADAGLYRRPRPVVNARLVSPARGDRAAARGLAAGRVLVAHEAPLDRADDAEPRRGAGRPGAGETADAARAVLLAVAT